MNWNFEYRGTVYSRCKENHNMDKQNHHFTQPNSDPPPKKKHLQIIFQAYLQSKINMLYKIVNMSKE